MSKLDADRVIEIITREQNLEPGKVTVDSAFAELGIDSLDMVNLIFALEQEFGRRIPDSVMDNALTVRQVVDRIGCVA